MRVFAPGRVNLIGDHTDYTGGLVLPMAVQLGTMVSGTPGGGEVRLTSTAVAGEVVVTLDVADPGSVEPSWGRYVAGVVSVLRPSHGFTGDVTTTLPVGSGLSSSAALEVAVALALGFEGTTLELALACRDAEQRASGVPCGVMDQLASAAGVEGHALLIDCTTLEVAPVAVPVDGVEVVVVDSGEPRALADSAYAERRASCEAAASVIGPLRDAALADVSELEDPVLRQRARHVVTENARVRSFADALRGGRLDECGALMVDSHRSLAVDFEVSTPRLDEVVTALVGRPGVYGARLTGAGFGGCVVALAQPGAIPADEGWHVSPVGGARVLA